MQNNGLGRYELKYVLDQSQYQALFGVLAGHMQPDPHGDEAGRYLVTSLYYDTQDYKAYWDKMDGLRFRRKLRLRVYDTPVITPEITCSVEIKQRTNRTVLKKRVVLSYASAMELCEMRDGINGVPGSGQAVMDEVRYLCSVQRLRPACVVSYERQALMGTERDPGLRVTFDTTMKGRVHDLSLLLPGTAADRYFLPPPRCIMEIKADGYVPYWLTKLISEQRCTPQSVSKYCMALEKCLGTLQRQRVTSYQPAFRLGYSN